MESYRIIRTAGSMWVGIGNFPGEHAKDAFERWVAKDYARYSHDFNYASDTLFVTAKPDAFERSIPTPDVYVARVERIEQPTYQAVSV